MCRLRRPQPPSEHQVFEKANGQPVETDFFSVEVGLPIVAKGDEPTSEQNWSRFGFSLVAQDVLQPDSKARQLALRIAEHAAPEADESGSPATSDDPELLPIAPSLSSGSPSMQSLRRLSLPPDPDLTSFTHPDDPAIVSYLRRTLEKVQSFRHDLTTLYDPSKASSYPSLGIIASSTTATVRGVRVDSEQDIVAGDFSRLLFDHGDGIVLHSSATALPACWTPHLKVTEASTYGHVSLLSDLDVVDRALARLL